MTVSNLYFSLSDLKDVINKFLQRVPQARQEGCPLWVDEETGLNLWFQGVERKRPALLAVRTELDNAINYRESQTESGIHAANTVMRVNRGQLKDYLVRLCRQNNLKHSPVYQLTVQKAHGETLARVLDLSGWDSL